MRLNFSFLLIFLSLGSCFGQNFYEPIGKDTHSYFVIADTALACYRLPAQFQRPGLWQKAEEKRAERGGNDWYGADYHDSLSLAGVLYTLDYASSMYEVSQAKRWCIHHFREAFPHLVARLTHKKKVGLEGTADLIIWDRIQTGDLKFYGHGGVIGEDLFTVAGRASWILNDLTGESFAFVRVAASKADLLDYKSAWKHYLAKLKP